MTAEGLSNLLARIRDLAEQLTVPLIFAGGGSGGETWRYEPETLIAGDYWIHKVLPSLLLSVEAELVRAQEFLTGTTDASQQSEIDDTLKLLILGLAKFVSPSRVTLLPLPSPSNVQGSALDEAESQSLFPGPKGPDLISSFTGTYRNQSRAKGARHEDGPLHLLDCTDSAHLTMQSFFAVPFPNTNVYVIQPPPTLHRPSPSAIFWPSTFYSITSSLFSARKLASLEYQKKPVACAPSARICPAVQGHTR